MFVPAHENNQQTKLGFGIFCVSLDYESIELDRPVYIFGGWSVFVGVGPAQVLSTGEISHSNLWPLPAAEIKIPPDFRRLSQQLRTCQILVDRV